MRHPESVSSEPAIRLRGVVKRFGPITAVDGLDLDVPEGTCVGLLGPNGAGKSTTMRLLTAQAIADEGELEVLGYRLPGESKQARAQLGVTPQLDNLDTTLTVEQNLLVFTHLYRIARAERRDAIERSLELAKLGDRRDTRVDKLSGGMRRRLLIARALVHRPRLVLLDEPTVGLDPQVGTVDRLQSVGTGGREDGFLRGQPRVEVTGSAQRRREVRVAEDQRLEPGRRPGDLLHAAQPGRCLDERLDAERPASAAGCLHAVQQAVDEGKVARALDFRQDDRGRPVVGRPQRGQVEMAPRSTRRVHAYRNAGAAPLGKHLGSGRARLVLRRHRDRVLEVDDDLVRGDPLGLGEHARRGPRNG